VRSAHELADAIAAGRLDGIRGIGAKTIEKMRTGLSALEKRTGRFRLFDADQLVVPLLEHIRALPAVEHVEAAGSYRRRRETVGDIDLLVLSTRPAAVMKHFLAYPEVERVEASGRTRGTIVLRTGLHVDLRVLPRQSYGAALHYFTGSKAHNIAIRRLGVERGLRISEYGVFSVGRGKRARPVRRGGEQEEDVFRAVGLPWIPPELREDRGEIGAAREGHLPRLITLDDVRGDLQMHSTWSDGNDSMEAMAAACVERGYAYMAITDHSPSATIARGLDPRDITRQAAEVAKLRRQFPRLRILHGLEIDILRDGSLDLPDTTLQRLDLVVVSIHSAMGLDRKTMTERVIRALSHKGVHILAHPTGRLINRREPIDIDLEAVLVAAAANGVAVEINAQPDRLDLDDVQAQRAMQLGVLLVINTDAHSAETLGFMKYGVDQARRAWLEPKHVLNTYSTRALEAWLDERRIIRPARRTAVPRRPGRKTPARARRVHRL
jgi:DNA polymerase (family 10)